MYGNFTMSSLSFVSLFVKRLDFLSSFEKVMAQNIKLGTKHRWRYLYNGISILFLYCPVV